MAKTAPRLDVGIEQQARKEIADGLGRALADTFTLYLKTHGYHWNVTGSDFASLHAMFEKQYEELWRALDDIAERIRALGSFAPADTASLAALTSIDESDKVPGAKEMVADLLAGHETVARNLRELAERAAEHADEATLDLLTERLGAHEKAGWMLRSTLA